MTSLITGITGFVGRHLIHFLREKGDAVAGIDQMDEFDFSETRYFQASILDSCALERIISDVKPDRIYHLAGISYLPEADSGPRHALETNILGTTAVLDAVRKIIPDARILVVGSSKEYGKVHADHPLTETMPTAPIDFYAVSKASAELIGLQYARQFNLDVRFTRSFNHTGPGQSPRFVCSDWAQQVAHIARGNADPVISVGDIGHEIDFTDVRDVVAAYWSILEKGTRGEIYNVCSGTTISLRSILDYLIAKVTTKVTVKGSDQKLRAHQSRSQTIGDNSKLLTHTGWKQQIRIEQTLDDLFAYWMREQL